MSDEARETLPAIGAPRRCADCLAFGLLRDAVASALLRGSLGQVLTGQPIQAHQALAPRVPSGGHTGQVGRDPIKRLAKVRGSLQGRLAAIDGARKAITGIVRDGEGVATAVQVEVRHQCGIIAKETQRARETLAGTGLHK